MDIQQVRYFLAVAEAGNFTAAAQRCGVAQPSLSQQIHQLERSLGNRLFDRLPRKVLLTAAGRELLERARGLVVAFDDFCSGVRGGEVRGTLSVAACPSLAPYIVAPAVAGFAQMHRLVDASLHELPAEMVLERVRAGECDLGIVGTAVDDPQILVEPLFSEMLVVAVPSRHALARKQSVAMRDLDEAAVILLDEMKGAMGPVGKLRKGMIRGRGLQLATAEALVAAGVGPCVLPAMARAGGPRKGIVYRPFEGISPVRVVSAVWHRDRERSRTSVAFMEVMRGVVARVL